MVKKSTKNQTQTGANADKTTKAGKTAKAKTPIVNTEPPAKGKSTKAAAVKVSASKKRTPARVASSPRSEPAKKAAQKAPSKKKIKRKRRPVSASRVRAAAISSPTMADAEVSLKLKRPLADILSEFPDLSAAWARGRLLKTIAQFARTAATITEAGESLSLPPGKFAEMLKTDPEVADAFHEARLQTIIKIKTAIVDRATDGNVTAARQVETILRREIVHPAIDFGHLSTDQMVAITGRSRQTVHDWVSKHGLPRNADKTFSMPVFVKWFEGFVFRKADIGKAPASANLNPFQAAKAQQMQLDLDRQLGNLLDRGMVISGLIARHQGLVNSLTRGVDDLAMVCFAQPQEKIAEILDSFFGDVRAAQCQVPDVLQLPAELAAMFNKLLTNLKPEGDK